VAQPARPHAITVKDGAAGLAPFETAILFVVGALICVLRNPLVFLHPIAAWEDGTQGITLYHQPGAPLFHMYSGYIQAWPDLIYRVVMLTVPLAWTPFALNFTSLAITAAIVPAAFGFLRYALKLDHVPSIICAVAIGIVPAGDWVMMSTVDYSIWPIAAILILGMCNPVPAKIAGQCRYVIWRALALATNPLSLPIAIVWSVFAIRAERRGERWVYGLLTLTAATYAMFGVEHHHQDLMLMIPAGAQALRLAVQSSLLALLPGAPLIGDWPRLWLLAAVLLAIGAAIAAIRRRPYELLIFGLGMGAICMICALGRGVQFDPHHFILTNRYAYVPRLLWCCLIAATLADLWRRHMAIPTRLGIATVCALLLALQVTGLAGAYAWNDIPTSDRLLTFLADSSARIKAGQPGPFKLTRIDQYGDWSIVVGGPARRTP
jgi:hypothetical protein